MKTISISKDMNGTFWVKNGEISTASLRYERAKEIAARIVKEVGGEEHATIDDRAEKVSESTIRRKAQKAGYRLRKSRKVNTTLDDQGEYMLIDVDTGFPACGYRYDASLEDVAEFLSDGDGEAA